MQSSEFSPFHVGSCKIVKLLSFVLSSNLFSVAADYSCATTAALLSSYHCVCVVWYIIDIVLFIDRIDQLACLHAQPPNTLHQSLNQNNGRTEPCAAVTFPLAERLPEISISMAPIAESSRNRSGQSQNCLSGKFFVNLGSFGCFCPYPSQCRFVWAN
ncbi:hypothetical protein Pst134EB_002383 [Puccinia striiformis f. sp. tritici]|nr:hypothetical protein Pst134EB_002383 [Puccinia striiformis f. sp. tritici]